MIRPVSATSDYIGRFAPSPTGPLHLGSLFTAVASFLDARSHQGKWLLRIDDIDTPRNIAHADRTIQDDLKHFGLHWDDEVIYQSEQLSHYRHAYTTLLSKQQCYRCYCSRKSLQSTPVYPGTCRQLAELSKDYAVRVKTSPDDDCFQDPLQGTITYNLAQDTGDFIILRKDKIFAYQLAVVVDDYHQHVTHVVRGFDLLDSTPRQRHLQQLLDYPSPNYMHLPVLLNNQGDKLSKQTHAPAVGQQDPIKTLFKVLQLLNQSPPLYLLKMHKEQLLQWAITHWQPTHLEKVAAITL